MKPHAGQHFSACPKCGSPRVIPIIYGEVSPAPGQVEGKDFVAGGVASPDGPGWYCRKCRKRWTLPDLIAAQLRGMTQGAILQHLGKPLAAKEFRGQVRGLVYEFGDRQLLVQLDADGKFLQVRLARAGPG